MDDIATMKLSAIAQRGSKEDFIDMYALLVKHKSLDALITAYCRRYHLSDSFNVLQAMTYFDDADEERTPRMLWNIRWSAMKRRIQECVIETVERRAKQR